MKLERLPSLLFKIIVKIIGLSQILKKVKFWLSCKKNAYAEVLFLINKNFSQHFPHLRHTSAFVQILFVQFCTGEFFHKI